MTNTENRAETRDRTDLASSTVRGLEQAWGRLIQHSTLSMSEKIAMRTPVFILGSGRKGLNKLKYGHYRHAAWHTYEAMDAGMRPEIFISGEVLGRGAHQTLVTMAHEAAHMLASIRGVRDTSRQGRWHNRRFVELARCFHLDYDEPGPDPKIGFSDVTPTETFDRKYRTVIEELSCEIQAWLSNENAVELPTAAPTTRRRSVRVNCPDRCGEPLSQAQGDDRDILCGTCGKPMEPVR